MSRSAALPFLTSVSLVFALLGVVAAGPASAEEPKRSFGTRSCDRATMVRDSGAARPLVAGALAIGEIARAMAPADHSCVGWALGRGATNVAVSWDNPAGRARYTVTPTRTYESVAGERCRDYVMTAAFDKGPQRNENSACRNKDGAWHLTVHNGAPVAVGAAVLQAAAPAADAPTAAPTPTPKSAKAKKAAQSPATKQLPGN
jgi:surface antigen